MIYIMRIILLMLVGVNVVFAEAFYDRPYAPTASIVKPDGTVFIPKGEKTDGWRYLMEVDPPPKESYYLGEIPNSPLPFPLQAGGYAIFRVLVPPGTTNVTLSTQSTDWKPARAANYFDKQPIPCTGVISESGKKCGGSDIPDFSTMTWFNPQDLPPAWDGISFDLYTPVTPLGKEDKEKGNTPTAKYYYFVVGATATFGTAITLVNTIGFSEEAQNLFKEWVANKMPVQGEIITYELGYNPTPENGKVEITSCEEVNGVKCVAPYNKSPFKQGTKVTLAAIPNPGFTDIKWGDDATACKIDTCSITMDKKKTVSVTFATPPKAPMKPKLQLDNNFGGIIKDDEKRLLRTQITTAQAGTLPVVFSVITSNPITNSWVQRQEDNLPATFFGLPAHRLTISPNKWFGIDAAICPACSVEPTKSSIVAGASLKLVAIVGWADNKIGENGVFNDLSFTQENHLFEKSPETTLFNVTPATEWKKIIFNADMSFSNLEGFREVSLTVDSTNPNNLKQEYFVFNVDDGIIFNDTNKNKSLLIFVGYQYVSDDGLPNDFLFLSEPLILNAK